MEEKKESLLKSEESEAIETFGTLFADGKAKNVRIRRDSNGDISYLGVSDKILGIF